MYFYSAKAVAIALLPPSKSAYDDLEDHLDEQRQERFPLLNESKNAFEMSEITSIPLQAQSGKAFPRYYRPVASQENIPELPDNSGNPPVNRGQPPSGETFATRSRKRFYPPIPEEQRLGYLSTAALIVNKMIGTGIFSKPSEILLLTGSKGGAMFLWVAGGVMTLSGLVVYLEFGMILPLNGGELVYLAESFPRPKYLASCIFAVLFVLLGNTTANAIAFAKHMLVAFNDNNLNPDYRLQRFIALVCVSFICLIHLFSRKMGILVNNALAAYKVGLLLFVVAAGFACLAGAGGKDQKADEYGVENLEHAFAGSSGSPYGYASAMLSVLFTYRGWENANYVLAEVERPRKHESRTFKRAVLVAFTIVTVLYILANVAYFAASTTQELTQDGIFVASHFFIKVFGQGKFVKRGLRVLIALSAFGNIVAVTYANARVKQEIAKLRILPFSEFWAMNSRYDTPVGALLLHWIFTALVIVATPNYGRDEGYNLVSNFFTYGHTWVRIFVTIGLTTLPLRKRFRDWKPKMIGKMGFYALAGIHIILSAFIIILIWWPHKATIPSIVTPVLGTSALGLGIMYWIGFAKVLPWLGYIIDSNPDELVDGTRIVTFKRNKTGRALEISDFLDRIFKRSP